MDNSVPSSQQRPVAPPPAPTKDVPDAWNSEPDSKPVETKPKPQEVSVPNKEVGPIAASGGASEQGVQAEKNDEEEMKVAKQEVMLGQKISPGKEVPLSDELKEAGVEQGTDVEQEIPTVVQRAGMRASSNDDSVPVSAIPQIKLPINYEHAKQLDKQSKIKESIKWFARELERQWKRMWFFEKHKGEKLEDL